jgi:predicted nuclease of predicted toxin-antitoxin system
LEKSEPTRSRFNAAEIVSILTEYAGGEADFNDQVLAELCRADNLKLVTHDADFSGSNLTILTANPKLLIEQ